MKTKQAGPTRTIKLHFLPELEFTILLDGSLSVSLVIPYMEESDYPLLNSDWADHAIAQGLTEETLEIGTDAFYTALDRAAAFDALKHFLIGA